VAAANNFEGKRAWVYLRMGFQTRRVTPFPHTYLPFPSSGCVCAHRQARAVVRCCCGQAVHHCATGQVPRARLLPGQHLPPVQAAASLLPPHLNDTLRPNALFARLCTCVHVLGTAQLNSPHRRRIALQSKYRTWFFGQQKPFF